MANKNLIYINSLESLQAERAAVKMRLKEREKDFQERVHKLPLEVIKGTIGSVIPFFLSNKVASSTWHVLKGIFGIAFGGRTSKNKSIKETVFSSAKKWGWVTLAKTLYAMLMK